MEARHIWPRLISHGTDHNIRQPIETKTKDNATFCKKPNILLVLYFGNQNASASIRVAIHLTGQSALHLGTFSINDSSHATAAVTVAAAVVELHLDLLEFLVAASQIATVNMAPRQRKSLLQLDEIDAVDEVQGVEQPDHVRLLVLEMHLRHHAGHRLGLGDRLHVALHSAAARVVCVVRPVRELLHELRNVDRLARPVAQARLRLLRALVLLSELRNDHQCHNGRHGTAITTFSL